MTMTKPKKLTSKSTFSEMIKHNCLYVDKTKHIYPLFTEEMNYNFLARPRRFGKSLLISTLKELFSGNKKLFEGLWIHSSDWEWKQHPVIHLDFSKIEHRTENELIQNLIRSLEKMGKEHQADLSSAVTPGAKLDVLVEALTKKEKVVILIDEYDKPIMDHINNPEIAEKNREVLKSFYDVIKGQDENLHAIFVTGVSKFAKTSIFSGINNLNDISQDDIAASLLGYTQQEVEHYLTPYITDMAKARGKSQQEIFAEMKQWYNGYRFSEKDVRVYNPFSTLYYLTKQKRSNYWIDSGNPTFLMRRLQIGYELIPELADLTINSEDLGPFEPNDIPLIPLLYQTGYLTITDTFLDGDDTMYKLAYPNEEIRRSFTKYIVIALAYSNKTTINSVATKVKQALTNNDLAAFCLQLRIMLANVPYFLHIKAEHYYHSLIKAFLYGLNLEVQAEVMTNKGRIDLVITMPKRIYIIELKFDKTPQIAMQQIHETKYYEKYLAKGLPLTLAGISINYEEGKELTLDFIEEQM